MFSSPLSCGGFSQCFIRSGVPEAFKLACRQQAGNQASSDEPGGRAAYAVLAAQRLGFVDGGKSGPIQPSGMKSGKIDSKFRRMPLDNGGVSEVLTADKVGGKERFVKQREFVGLMPPDPLGSG